MQSRLPPARPRSPAGLETADGHGSTRGRLEQDVVRVTHVQDVDALKRRGAEIERAVLARAVQWHSQDRGIIRHGNTTVVF
jgi:hypothetical protein